MASQRWWLVVDDVDDLFLVVLAKVAGCGQWGWFGLFIYLFIYVRKLKQLKENN